MKSAIIALAFSVLLTGCNGTITNAPPKLDKLTVPDVVEYPAETQEKAATEMKLCHLVPTLCEFIVDYGVMRDQARAARGIKVDVSR